MGLKVACALCVTQVLLAVFFRVSVHADWSFLYAQCTGILLGSTTISLAALVFDLPGKPPIWWGWYMLAGNSAASIWFDSTVARLIVTTLLGIGALLW